MAFQTLSFLEMHELRHVYGGHLDYGQNVGVSFFQEAQGAALDPELARIKQAFEWDADATAMNHAFNRIIGWQTYKNIEHEHFGEFFDSHAQVLESILIVHDAYLKIFDTGYSPDPSGWTTLSHPPLIVRRSMFVDRIVESISHPNTKNFWYIRDEFQQSIAPRVHATLDRIMGEIFGNSLRDSNLDALKPSIEVHKAYVKDAWRELRPEMAFHRYFDTDSDQPD